MRKTQTWDDNLNDVIRDVIFPNTEMLDLMLIPNDDRSDIIKFIDKYFVKDVTTDELLTTEDVRICYFKEQGRSIGMRANKQYLCFDIYVKDKVQHTASNDLLKNRDELIAQKLQELLTDQRYVCKMRFEFVNAYDLYTRTVGYHRYRIEFSYKITF